MKRKTADSKEIDIRDMTTEHIKNCVKHINMNLRCEFDIDENELILRKKRFAVELIRRWEFDFIIDELLDE